MFKTYSEYKKSGLPWLDVVPAHWGETRAKGLYQKEDRPVLNSDDVVTCFRDGVVTLRKNRRTTGFTESLKEIGYQRIRKGDLVIHAMDAFAGAIGVSDSDGKGTPVYSVCTAKKDINNHYYAHVLREMAKRGFIQSLYRGIRERSSDFRFETFARQYLPVPPRTEQDQIVRFLDSKLSKIARLLNAKKKQISLLKEQKQAIINKAVTKGLDPNAKMKPSGVEWLGDIPTGWGILRNKSVLKEQKELVGALSSNYTLLSLTTNGVIVRDVESNKGKFPKEFDSYKVVSENNMIFCLFDIEETPRTVGLSSYNGMITGAYDIFSVHDICEKYLYNYYLAIDDIKAMKPLYTGLRKVINVPTFLGAKIPVPPRDEQEQIVSYIEQKSARIDKTISVTEREIALIGEYRTRLISDAITGKIDVRDVEVTDSDVEQEIEMDETEEMNESEEIFEED